MPRQLRKTKPLIYVFCEGESEQAYTEFLRTQFRHRAVIKCVPQTGLFTEAKDKFQKDARYRSSIEVTDEIWFFFDVEDHDIPKWDKRLKIIRHLQKLRKKPHIRIRLLMTTACVEYWFMLHYKMTAPPLHTVADKERMLQELRKYVSAYKKGDRSSILEIGSKYQTAIRHGAQTLEALLADGLPSLADSDERSRWLCQCGKTFTTVQEAIQFLESLTET